MKFADLSIKQNWITHKINDKLEFKEKTHLTFEEEVEIVVGVINVVMANTIIDGVIYDKELANKYLMVFYTLIATDIEFTIDEINDTKNIMEVLTSNEIDKIYYGSSKYRYLYSWILDLLRNAQTYNTTFSGTIANLIEKLPKQIEEISKAFEDGDVLNKVTETLNNLSKDEKVKLN